MKDEMGGGPAMVPHAARIEGVQRPGCEVGWIRVEDELPDDSETVLVFCPLAIEPVWLGFYSEGEWRDVSGASIAHEPPSHWRRMPEPPVAVLGSGVTR